MTRDTSISAYRAIEESGALSRSRWDVFTTLFHCGPATAMSVFKAMGQRRGNKVAANVYARLAELREMGVVKELGTTPDPDTGMDVILWDVTSNMPIPFKKRSNVKQRLDRLEDRVTALELSVGGLVG